MTDASGEQEPARPGRTRKARFAMVLFANLLATGVLLVLTATSALPVSFNLSGLPFKVSAERFDSDGFLQIPRLENTPDGRLPVGVTTVVSAEIRGLCESVVIPSPAGPVTVRITAGKQAPVTVKNLALNLTDLAGNTTFRELHLGPRPPGHEDPGAIGGILQRADSVSIDQLRVKTNTLAVGTMNLTDMRFKVVYGAEECF
ncbi:DUF6230 family protein [Saccharopolyspora phatthalungensis]|uniref:Cholesterol esterase n=1 Tax=Saccharopolyspora phatthalungensis TaxID=664693 RepID=A0A840QG26_9PSEU|nr:DUF6230 family protein [Saccharopolyspora phatthalungensis]MBB5158900.1 hypothetical protein [Saccharopolyspora phatthalungensis]